MNTANVFEFFLGFFIIPTVLLGVWLISEKKKPNGYPSDSEKLFLSRVVKYIFIFLLFIQFTILDFEIAALASSRLTYGAVLFVIVFDVFKAYATRK